MRRELILAAMLGLLPTQLIAQGQPNPRQVLGTRTGREYSSPEEVFVEITENKTTLEYDVNVSGVKFLGIPVPGTLTPARSTFTMQEINRNFLSENTPKLTEDLEGLLAGLPEDTELYHLTYKTQLTSFYETTADIARHLVDLAGNVDYQYSEEIAIKTERGYRPIKGIHKIRKNGRSETICEKYFHNTNEYERTKPCYNETVVEKQRVPENVMQDTHSALTLRLTLANLKLRCAPHSFSLGYMWGSENYFPIQVNFTPHGRKGIVTFNLEEYLEVNATTTVTVPYTRVRNVFASSLKDTITFIVGGVSATFEERR